MPNKNTEEEVIETTADTTAVDEVVEVEVEQEDTTPEAEAEIKTFHAFSLVEVLEEFQKLVQKGYVIDLEHNETYPQLYGTHYIISVTKPAKVSKLAGLKLKGRN